MYSVSSLTKGNYLLWILGGVSIIGIILLFFISGCGGSNPMATDDGGTQQWSDGGNTTDDDGGQSQTDEDGGGMTTDGGVITDGGANTTDGGQIDAGAPDAGHCPNQNCDDGIACTDDHLNDYTCQCEHIALHGRCGTGQICYPEQCHGCCGQPTCATASQCPDPHDPCIVITCEESTATCRYTPLDRDGDGHSPKACASVGGDDCDDTKSYIYAGAPKRCNGEDNDCDGQIDEGMTRPCTTACGTGTEMCANRTWVNCTARTPSTEICDEIDNDCDGDTDENWSNKGQPCSVGVGACQRTGTYVCSPDHSRIECSVQPGQPSDEICDGVNNDCDNQTDENFPTKGQPCTVGVGACQRTGIYVCKPDHSGVECNVQPGQPTQETCDNVDNNCDGRTDELWSNKGQSCTVGIGACKRTGIYVCKPDHSGVECNVQPGQPDEEICDGIDNDCDTLIDNSETINASCDDHVACTADSCDLNIGRCKYLPQNNLCSDGLSCTEDVCTPSGCQFTSTCGPDNVCASNGCLLSGKIIYASSENNNSKIVIMDLISRNEQHILNTYGGWGLDVSPTEDKIALSKYDAGIVIIDFQGNILKTIKQDYCYYEELNWGNSDNLIVKVSSSNWYYCPPGLWSINPASGNATIVFQKNAFDDQRNNYPTWSIDGTKIAFLDNGELYVKSVNPPQNPFQIIYTGSSYNQACPQWIAGDSIAYYRGAYQTLIIQKVNINTREEHEIINIPSTDHVVEISASPTGNHIVYIGEGSNPFPDDLWIAKTDGTLNTKITNTPNVKKHWARWIR